MAMKKLEEIDQPLDPIKTILRDFLHVEWYEIDDLRERILSGRIGENVVALHSQFIELLQSNVLPVEQINALTMNEFETSEETKAWLSEIYLKVFPGDSR